MLLIPVISHQSLWLQVYHNNYRYAQLSKNCSIESIYEVESCEISVARWYESLNQLIRTTDDLSQYSFEFLEQNDELNCHKINLFITPSHHRQIPQWHHHFLSQRFLEPHSSWSVLVLTFLSSLSNRVNPSIVSNNKRGRRARRLFLLADNRSS